MCYEISSHMEKHTLRITSANQFLRATEGCVVTGHHGGTSGRTDGTREWRRLMCPGTSGFSTLVQWLQPGLIPHIN
ncbi:unnamed protein product [Gadus morhua 'NCC']